MLRVIPKICRRTHDDLKDKVISRGKMSETSFKTTVEWEDINWRKLERTTYKLQKRIYRASQSGNVKIVRRLQKILMKSWSAKALAVRKVTQDNKGKKTAGVDGVKSLYPKRRLELIKNLKLGVKSKPTRRVWIEKPGKKEKRPLGIPTMYDRALQALTKMALEPEWEAKFEPNSFGFRPGRSCHDAIEAIFNAIVKKPKYVLDADIAQCFDKINHDKLIDKLNSFPAMRRQIKAWLKSGVIDKNEFFNTTEGTPQGGVISSLLANIALHGMENHLNEFAKTLDIKNNKGHQISWINKVRSLTFIRYADDFVILHDDLEVVKKSKEVISDWLNDMGLELKPSKTRLAHTMNILDENKPGFDFLGFNIRQYSKNQSKIGFKTLIKPSNKSVKTHYRKISRMIHSHNAVSQVDLITHLNPIIRGWSNYYSRVISAETFQMLDHLMCKRLIKWAKRRHPHKNMNWMQNKYWQPGNKYKWDFTYKEGDEIISVLLRHGLTPIQRHTKVKGEASPYDGNLTYWSSRMGKSPGMPERVANLLKRQKGKCNECGLFFRNEDVIETDHIIPLIFGGKNEYKNLQLLHRHCHHKKTARDGSHKKYS